MSSVKRVTRRSDIVFEAFELRPDNYNEAIEFIGLENILGSVHHHGEGCALGPLEYFWLKTLEGRIKATAGTHHIIKGVKGEVWPVRNDIFAETYQPVTEPHRHLWPVGQREDWGKVRCACGIPLEKFLRPDAAGCVQTIECIGVWCTHDEAAYQLNLLDEEMHHG